ncbi:MAG: hypothetical protein MHM6MM_005304 [Cercozoa sp. M6MM]
MTSEVGSTVAELLKSAPVPLQKRWRERKIKAAKSKKHEDWNADEARLMNALVRCTRSNCPKKGGKQAKYAIEEWACSPADQLAARRKWNLLLGNDTLAADDERESSHGNTSDEHTDSSDEEINDSGWFATAARTLFNSMPRFDNVADDRKLVSWNLFEHTAKPGDVLLFAGVGNVATIIRTVQRTRYSHCGMLVPDPRDPSRPPLVVEAASNGVQLTELHARLSTRDIDNDGRIEEPGPVAWLRLGTALDVNQLALLNAAVSEVAPHNWPDHAHTALHSKARRATKKYKFDATDWFLPGKDCTYKDERERPVAGMGRHTPSRFFCSMLVAWLYQKCNVFAQSDTELAEYEPCNAFAPREFSTCQGEREVSKFDVRTCFLNKSQCFHNEVQVVLEPAGPRQRSDEAGHVFPPEDVVDSEGTAGDREREAVVLSATTNALQHHDHHEAQAAATAASMAAAATAAGADGDVATNLALEALAGTDGIKGALVLELAAEDLPKTDVFGHCDPYCVLYKKTDDKDVELAHTEVKNDTSSPIWEQLLVPISEDEIHGGCVLRFVVKDRDHLRPDKKVGASLCTLDTFRVFDMQLMQNVAAAVARGDRASRPKPIELALKKGTDKTGRGVLRVRFAHFISPEERAFREQELGVSSTPVREHELRAWAPRYFASLEQESVAGAQHTTCVVDRS